MSLVAVWLRPGNAAPSLIASVTHEGESGAGVWLVGAAGVGLRKLVNHAGWCNDVPALRPDVHSRQYPRCCPERRRELVEHVRTVGCPMYPRVGERALQVFAEGSHSISPVKVDY